MKELIRKFYEAFPDLKGNQAVDTFIRNPEHQELLRDYLQAPTKDGRDRLDEAFKVYYFGLRFTSYVSTSLYFHSVNFDKRMRRFEERNALTLDQPVGDEEGTTFKDQLADEPNGNDEEMETSLEESVESEALLEAYALLTDKQQEILTYAYVHQWKDVEIARKLGTSQQSVSKSHQRALKKLKQLLEGKE
ncbi:sigma-70 family RNA polymerase sigma factor [Halobacillus fulvus]|nr:sigma-70 family RNA polymerase sigma factor [Halobacillus fulvus]